MEEAVPVGATVVGITVGARVGAMVTGDKEIGAGEATGGSVGRGATEGSETMMPKLPLS